MLEIVMFILGWSFMGFISFVVGCKTGYIPKRLHTFGGAFLGSFGGLAMPVCLLIAVVIENLNWDKELKWLSPKQKK